MNSIKIWFIFIIWLTCFSTVSYSQDPNPRQVVLNAVNLMNGRSNQSEATMTITRPKWTRSISMKTWSMGNDYSMIFITEPAQDKGQVFLKRLTEMWNWLPSIGRIIRIPPSMMGQSWMGSDFTNNDLVKRNSLVNDYDQKFLGSDIVENYDTYKIQLVPKPNAAVIWGKVILNIAKKEYFLLKAEYYDEDGKLINLETQTDIKKFGDRNLPSRLIIVPVNEKGKKTTLVFKNIKFNINIKEDFFSQQNMKSIH